MMQIGSREDFLHIEVLERVARHRQGAGDLRVGVELSSNGFSGKYDEVWLQHQDIVEFVASFERLEAERRGLAQLRSMSPDELRIEFRPSDSLGHFEVEAQLARTVYGTAPQKASRVVGVFEVDPAELLPILKELRSW